MTMREHSGAAAPARHKHAQHRDALNPAHRYKIWVRAISMPWVLVATAASRAEAMRLAEGIVHARSLSGLYCVGPALPPAMNEAFVGVCASGKIIQPIRGRIIQSVR
jgi:hypothetical protein